MKLLFAVVGIFAFTAAVADETDDTGLTIEAQPLATALREFSEQTGLQIGYAAELVDGKETRGVAGIEEPDLVLDALLANSGLEHQFVNDETVVIRREASGSEVEVSSESGNLQSTSQQVATTQVQRPVREEQAVRNRSTTSRSDESEKAREIEEIVVTGSRIRGTQIASPVVTITRQEIDRAGYATVEDLIDKLPQNFGAGAMQDGFTDRGAGNAVGAAVADFAGGTSINLRGLGTGSTLVLLNGRRLNASGLEAQFVDISSIPLAAIERVEILTDGASAIYGADAIGGVVNFILRDDYEGAESRLRYAPDLGMDTSEILFGHAFGRSWGDGNVMVSYEYYHHDNLANTDRSFAASSNLTRFGGDDFRRTGGNPANIVAGEQTFAIPASQDGTSLTPADFLPDAPLNLYNYRAVEDLLPEQERHTVLLNAGHQISDRLELFAHGRFSTRRNRTRAEHALVDIEVPDTNPYFVDPTGTGLTTVRVDNYSVADDLGSRIIDATTDSYGGTLGLTFQVRGSWQGEFAGTYSRESSIAYSRNSLNRVRLQAAAAASDPAEAFNPFGDGSSTNSAVIDTLRIDTGDRDSAENELWAANLDFDGNLVEIPGGAMKAAAGFEYRGESIATNFTHGYEEETPTFQPGIDRSRNVFAAYAELFFPLVGEPNSRTGVRRFEVSLAGRYENYSDFGDSLDPKVSVIWSPVQSLSLRGTYGTSFKAPLLNDCIAPISPDTEMSDILEVSKKENRRWGRSRR